VWIARSIGSSENFNGEIIRPAETFVGNLAIFFGTSSLNSIWKGSSVLVRGAWQWVNGGKIFTPYTQIPFNERTYISIDVRPPFQIEFLVKADIRDYSYSAWEWEPIHSLLVTEQVLSDTFTNVLPENYNRIDFQITNTGPGDIEFYWGNFPNFTVLLPVGVELIESGTHEFRSLSSRSTTSSTIKIIERSET